MNILRHLIDSDGNNQQIQALKTHPHDATVAKQITLNPHGCLFLGLSCLRPLCLLVAYNSLFLLLTLSVLRQRNGCARIKIGVVRRHHQLTPIKRGIA